MKTHSAPATTLQWFPVAGVQPVVYVAKSEGRALAILEFQPGTGFRLVSCAGEHIGDYFTLEDGQTALENWLARSRVT